MDRCAVSSGKTEYSFWGKGAAIATFLTVLSQLPLFVQQGLSSSIARVVWIAFFVVILLLKHKDLRIRQVTLAFTVIGIYVVFVLIMSLLGESGKYNTGLFSCVLLSFFILMVGLLIGKEIKKQDLYLCGKVYVLGSLILATILYFDVYRNYDISNIAYAYGSKNSVGVILFTGALIAFVYGWHPTKWLANLANLLILGFLIYMVMVMKVRAMIVCIPVVALCAVLRAPFRRKVRIPLILLCVALLVLLQIDSVYDILINNILFASRGDDLASASSGRAEQWLDFFENLKGKELIGDGWTEQESLILTAFLQCGIPMGGLIIAYGAWPLAWSLRATKRTTDKTGFLLLLIALVYFMDAIFEQLAPFGPGARCFYLWLLFGVILAKGQEEQDQEQDDYRYLKKRYNSD